MMKRTRLLQVGAMLLALLLLASCSGAADKSASSAPNPMPSAAPMEPGAGFPDGDMGMDAEMAPQAPAEGSNVYASDAKIIRRATLALQSTTFDTATASLNQLVVLQGGYYEQADVQQGDYYGAQAARYGSYIVRVPKGSYQAFLDAVGNVGHVVSKSESSQDVGEVYFDTEARLKTQRTKYDRLLALLEKADKMEDIIQLEDALSQVEYEIERLSTDLRRYDSLVDYATIAIDLQEVLVLTPEKQQSASFTGRLGIALTEGFHSFTQGAGDLVIALAYNLVGVLILAGLAVVGLVVGRKYLRKRRGDSAPPDTKDE